MTDDQKKEKARERRRELARERYQKVENYARTLDGARREGYREGSRAILRHLYGAATVAEVTLIGIILYRKPRDLTPAEHSALIAPALIELNKLGLLDLAHQRDEGIPSEKELAKLAIEDER